MKLLYALGISLVKLFLPFASIFNVKVKMFLESRKAEKLLFAQKVFPADTIWFHCASLGEYEQAKPLIQYYKAKDFLCLVSFFSPSGYRIIKPKEDEKMHVTYLPLENKKEVRKFIDQVSPQKIFWIKYELWLITLDEVFARKIPSYLVSARFYESHFITKWWAKVWRNCLLCFTQVFVQERESEQLLSGFGIKSIISGDMRFDNVLSLIANKKANRETADWAPKENTLILGSSWPEEEEIAFAFFKSNPSVKGIIAPHDVSAHRIMSIKNKLNALELSFGLWSNGDLEKGYQILVVDVIGVLSQLYPCAKLAFVGGGFSGGLHNILEPLAWNISVVTGPKIHKNWEAKSALDIGASFIVEQKEDLQKVWDSLTANDNPIKYVREKSGALRTVISNL